MRRRYFVDVDLDQITEEQHREVLLCRMRGRFPFYEVSAGLRRDIDIECDEEPCGCAEAFRPWRDNWSKMPR
jgi:hypothetical protein